MHHDSSVIPCIHQKLFWPYLAKALAKCFYLEVTKVFYTVAEHHRLHFTQGEIEALRGKIICFRSSTCQWHRQHENYYVVWSFKFMVFLGLYSTSCYFTQILIDSIESTFTSFLTRNLSEYFPFILYQKFSWRSKRDSNRHFISPAHHNYITKVKSVFC